MEGEPAESDEDVQEEDKPTVLWEKCIQQSIFVDLSEDESLHLSDLENSFALHLSQAESVASEASIHFSGSAELSDLDVSSSEPSTASSQSERPGETRNQSGVFHMSAQRPNTMQDKLPIKRGREDEGQNTSDEDQDDLPYDGDFGNQYFNQTADSEGERSADERESVHTSPDALHMPEMNQIQIDHLTDHVTDHVVSVACNGEEPLTSTKEDANTKQDDNVGPSKQTGFAPSCPADINQVLLQHFTQEELLRPGRLIEAETLPEVSLLESVDDSVLSFHPAHNSTVMNDNHSEIPVYNSETNQSSCSESTVEKSDNSSQHFSFKEEAGWILHNESIISSSERINSKQDILDTSAEDVVNPEKTEQDNPAPAVHTRSFTDIKYGQGKVHYPLPDFSKVAPKVKIPKAPSGLVRPFSQGPGTMHRTQSSPGMLDVITRVLEDSVLTPEEPCMFKEEDKQAAPTLVHHLQTEYDKLLAKYAEAENLIDQMRTGTNAQPSSDLMLDLDCEEDHPKNIPGVKGRHIGSLALNLPLSHSSLCLTSDITTCQRFASLPANNFDRKEEKISKSNIEVVSTDPLIQPEEGPSDGDRMTAELRDIISQFMQKVELFKLSVTNMSVSTAEQQMMLRSLMEAQDQLERKYISKKEEHRTLEMQNYIGLARNTGAFDPNRMVEGDIFRIGMHLEDIKEIIDRNVCEQISPPHLSSTPTPTRDIQHVMASPVCMASPSPPPSLHEGPSSSFSTAGFLKIENKEDKEREGKEATEVHGDDRVQQSDELIPDDPLMRNSGHSCDLSRSTQGSLEGLKILAAETEEERSSVFSDVISHSDILAYLDGARSSAGQRLGTPDSCGTLNSVPAVGECDPGDCMSLAVEVSFSSNAPRDSSTHNLSEPPLDSSSSSQRIVSPETDSGFGSSYLNQSASGSFQPNLLTDSAQSQNDGMNSTDSEGSCSNLQTAIHSASLTSQQWTNLSRQPQSCGGAGAVERWVESTTKESSVHLQGPECSLPAQLHHHVSEPVLSISMNTEDRGSPQYSCSCNSEAILALQSEVSRLKKDLEEGLVQLPHLAQKMDFLTSRYRQDLQESKSKNRPRTPLRPASNSVLKPSSCRQSNPSSSQVKIEDWISSDFDPSKSKSIDSSVRGSPEIMLQFQKPSPGSRRGSQSKLQSNKAADLESFHPKEMWSLCSSSPLQKPLLQVSYGSSCSLPASYKVREPLLESTSHYRKRSTQSDTALLPSNVFFQRTPTPATASAKTSSRAGRRRRSKEEEINRTLDQAIEMARSMKRTTDRMAKRLSADLTEAKLHRTLYNLQPLGGRKHHAL